MAHRGNRAAGEAGAGSGSVLEAPALVAGLDDLAMVGETIEERRGHLGVAEDGGPLAEGEVCGDDGRGSLVEPAHEVEEELAAGLGEGQVSELVEDDEVAADELLCDAALATGVARSCARGYAELGLEVVAGPMPHRPGIAGRPSSSGYRPGIGGAPAGPLLSSWVLATLQIAQCT